ncbi:MAG TPA: hypothetical protein VF384_03625 [Planctomycetota bacterium]
MLLRYRKFIATIALIGAVMGLLLGLMKPNSFTSTGTLLLRGGARESETPEAAVAGRTSLALRLFDVVANEIAILSHRDTFRRVVETIGEHRILEVYDPTAEDTEETGSLTRLLHRIQAWWFALSTAELVDATPEHRTRCALETVMDSLSLGAAGGSLIHVRYEAHSPQLAKEVTDAFLAAAEEHHRRVFSNRMSLELLSSMSEKAQRAEEAARAALAAFKDEHGIYDLDAQRTSLVTEISKLETQLAADEEELRSLEKRFAELNELLAGEQPVRDVVTEQPPTANPEYTALQDRITKHHSEIATILGSAADKFEKENRIAAFKRAIAETEGKLRDVRPTIPGPKSSQTLENPRWARLQTQLDDVRLDLGPTRITKDQRAERLAQMRKQLQQLEQHRSRHATLQASVLACEAEAKRIIENLKAQEVVNLLDENKIGNLRTLEAGDLPIQKTGPNRSRYLLGGAFVGLVLGFGFASLRQRLDRSLRRPGDLMATGTPLLGVIPELTGKAARQLGHGGGFADTKDASVRRLLDRLWIDLVPPALPATGCFTLALVGDGRGRGVTSLSLYLALRSARLLGLRVLLVETNYHAPALARRLGVEMNRGFADLVAGKATHDEVVRPTGVASLRIVYASSFEGQGALVVRRPDELVRSLREGFHLVVLDVPSVVEHPEFVPLLSCADAVVPVLAAGMTTRAGAEELLEAVRSAGKESRGVILNRWRSVKPFWLPSA